MIKKLLQVGLTVVYLFSPVLCSAANIVINNNSSEKIITFGNGKVMITLDYKGKFNISNLAVNGQSVDNVLNRYEKDGLDANNCSISDSQFKITSINAFGFYSEKNELSYFNRKSDSNGIIKFEVTSLKKTITLKRN